MRNIIWIPALVLTSWLALPCVAQTKAKAKTDAAAKNNMAPVFTTLLAGRRSNTVSVDTMKTLLDSALVARDSAGGNHQVVSFDFGYRTTDVFLNDTTGRPETSRLYTSFHFKGNRLDSLWRTEIGDEIKPGDELFFDRIIASDRGARYLSSALHFTVK
jgi:hypothetical protein